MEGNQLRQSRTRKPLKTSRWKKWGTCTPVTGQVARRNKGFEDQTYRLQIGNKVFTDIYKLFNFLSPILRGSSYMLCFSLKLFSGGRPELLPSRMLDV